MMEFPKSKSKRAIYDALYRYKAGTYTEVAKITYLPLNSVSARMHEMEAEGWIERTGKRLINGHEQTVYTACNPRKQPIEPEPKYLPIKRSDAVIIDSYANDRTSSFTEKYSKSFVHDEVWVRSNGRYTLFYHPAEERLSMDYHSKGIIIEEIDDTSLSNDILTIYNICGEYIFRIV